jgi:hypothetical protein
MSKTLEIKHGPGSNLEINGMRDVSLWDGDRRVWSGTVAKLVSLVDTVLHEPPSEEEE